MNRWISRTVTAITLTAATVALATPAMADTTETKPGDSAWSIPLIAEAAATVDVALKPGDSAW